MMSETMPAMITVHAGKETSFDKLSAWFEEHLHFLPPDERGWLLTRCHENPEKQEELSVLFEKAGEEGVRAYLDLEHAGGLGKFNPITEIAKLPQAREIFTAYNQKVDHAGEYAGEAAEALKESSVRGVDEELIQKGLRSRAKDFLTEVASTVSNQQRERESAFAYSGF